MRGARAQDDWPSGSGSFVAGTNTLEVLVNNTAGPGGWYMQGAVNYDDGATA